MTEALTPTAEALQILPNKPVFPFDGFSLAETETLEDEAVAQRPVSFLGIGGTVAVVKLGVENFEELDDEALLTQEILSDPAYKLVLILDLKTPQDLLKIQKYNVTFSDGSEHTVPAPDSDPFIGQTDTTDELLRDKQVQMSWLYPDNASEGTTEAQILRTSITLASR